MGSSMLRAERLTGGWTWQSTFWRGILDFSYMIEFPRAIQPAKGRGFRRAKTQEPCRGHYAERARSMQTRADRLALYHGRHASQGFKVDKVTA
jgi:hypothetical protein